MQDGFQFADIVFLAVLAGFILWRLRATLGKRTGFEGTPDAPHKIMQSATVIALPQRDVAPEPEEDLTLDTGGNHDVVRGLEAIRAKDPTFHRKRFLQGAKAAFEMVVEAFSRGDRRVLQGLLAPSVLAQFETEIERRQKAGEIVELTLVSAEASEVTAAELVGGATARISVKFDSEQIAITKNTEGAIVSGNASQIDKVVDTWTFERDLRNPNPNWTVVAT